MENYIRISTLNDFTFCPKSIYFHQLYEKYNRTTYQDTPQVEGLIAHESIDTKKYSSAKKYIQALSIYSHKYQIAGKIDIYNMETKTLTERKTKVEKIYQGYKYQLYAQYFCMIEMGYIVENLQIYSLSDNIMYPIPLPDKKETVFFESCLERYREFDPNNPYFTQNPKKCEKCIYKELCDYYLCTQYPGSLPKTSSKNNLLS